MYVMLQSQFILESIIGPINVCQKIRLRVKSKFVNRAIKH